MPKVKFTGNILDFQKDLKEHGIVPTSIAYTTEELYCETDTSLGNFRVKKGEGVDIPKDLELKVKNKWKIGKDTPLAPVFMAYIEDPDNAKKTFDDFYDDVGIPVKDRSDFITAAMLDGVKLLREGTNESGT